MDTSSLKYLASRLEQIDIDSSEDIAVAARLARKAESSVAIFERSSQAEHALYYRLWQHVSDALDHNNFSPEYANIVKSLEDELAGRCWTLRVSLGWVTQSATAPAEFPVLEEFLF